MSRTVVNRRGLGSRSFDIGHVTASAGWTGPIRARHDLCSTSAAWESKTLDRHSHGVLTFSPLIELVHAHL